VVNGRTTRVRARTRLDRSGDAEVEKKVGEMICDSIHKDYMVDQVDVHSEGFIWWAFLQWVCVGSI
jgi:hypothetical protein